jgi:hypothetical protein
MGCHNVPGMASELIPRESKRSRLLSMIASSDWWKWTIVPVGIAYLVVVARSLAHIVAGVEIDADAASAQMISELFAHRAGGTVYMANLPWYSTLIFGLATKWLPDHREIWVVGPYCLALLAIAVMAWTTSRLAGRWAAAVTAVILLCASQTMLPEMFWLNNHMSTFCSLALLAAFLVLLEERADSLPAPALAGMTLAVGVIVGVNAASDELLIIVGLAPVAIAGIATWRLHPGHRTAKALVLLLLLLLVVGSSAAATTSIMRSAHILPYAVPIKFANSDVILSNILFLFESIALLGNGGFFGEAITFTTCLYAACAVLSIAAIALVMRLTWMHVREQLAGHRSGDARLSAYLIFWTTSVVLSSAAFAFSSTPIELTTSRYLAALVFAAGACVPIMAHRGSFAKICVVLGTLIFSITSLISLLDGSLVVEPTQGPSPAVADDIAAVAERLHATQGFAQYWDASPITWSSDFRVVAYPIYGCPHSPTRMCPGPDNFITSWYRGLGSERTFLILNSAQTPIAPPPELGRPAATYRFGGVTMYIYDFDITSYLR